MVYTQTEFTILLQSEQDWRCIQTHASLNDISIQKRSKFVFPTRPGVVVILGKDVLRQDAPQESL